MTRSPAAAWSRTARLVVGVLLAMAVMIAGVAPAQTPGQAPPFRITFNVDHPQTGSNIRLVGRIFNTGKLEARNVTLTGEAVDAAGNLVASGATYVGIVAEDRSTGFVIPMPQSPRAVSYRVVVTGYQLGFTQPQSLAPVTDGVRFT
ncbi:MAG: hypothetical protein HY294_16360 [Candidatus Rokubacteria bacterium]|nr:hypothetical protein [Candidatus Rokubacteria bacterium]MBI3827565.1 hypothetical protein [Candidatus Rokubacteria bacterium]